VLTEDKELVREFLLESTQNLSDFETEMVELERNAKDAQLLGSIFRRIHTVKGSCGFFGFARLEKISHTAENVLSEIRAGERQLTAQAAGLLLQSVDAMRRELATIEATGAESSENYSGLLALFEKLEQSEAPPDRAVRQDSDSESGPRQVPAAEPPPLAVQAAAPAELGASAAKGSVADSAVRVDIAVLDHLMNLVGELVLARNQMLQRQTGKGRKEQDPVLQRLNLLTGELQDAVTRTRMQPITGVWNKLPRLVRDLSSSLGKDIELQMTGGETELDRGVLEAIRDPLTHMVRNSCDHGIETPDVRQAAGKPRKGVLRLRAAQEGGQVVIEIRDDGGGIDPERIKAKAVEKGLLTPQAAAALSRADSWRLIFLPGFSTAQAVTNVSGRGVGMDVVKRNIERIGGAVDLSSDPGKGTNFKIRIPLTLAILPALAVRQGDNTLLIPQRQIRNLVQLPGENSSNLEWVEGNAVLRDRGRLLPLAFLGQVLYPGRAFVKPVDGRIVVVQSDQQEAQFGLVVDDVIAIREIVVKPFGRELANVPCYAGATILGDGRVALVLDVQGVARHVGLEGTAPVERESASGARTNSPRQTLLLFQCGRLERLGVPLSLVERLEKFTLEQIEFSSGKPVVQYRGHLLPLLALSTLFEPERAASYFSAETYPAFVVQQQDRRIGVLVDRILDITSSTLAVRGQANGPYLLGSAVVNDKVTDLLNLAEAVQTLDAGFFQPRARERARGKRILVSLPSRFDRAMIRDYLEMAGHQVLEASSLKEALGIAAKQELHLLCCSIDSGQEGGEACLSEWSLANHGRRVPVIGLGAKGQAESRESDFDLYEFDARCEIFDRKALLAAIDRISLDSQAEGRK
jgi:two-component system, chemotaxis family, sensor kinase CheA